MAQQVKLPQQDQKPGGLGALFVIAGGLGVVLVTGLWWLYGPQIRYYSLLWKYYESWVFDWIPVVGAWRDQMAAGTAAVGMMDIEQLLLLTWAPSLLWVWIPIALGVWMYRRGRAHPVTRAHRIHNLQSLMAAQVHNFSAIAPIIDRDGTRDTSPQARPADRPEEWAAKFDLIRSDRPGGANGQVAASFDDGKARRVLIENLGQPHDPIANWQPHEMAMFAVLAEAALEDLDGMESSRKLRDALNYSARNAASRPNYALATSLFNKWWRVRTKHAALRILVQRHRYIRTLLYALLMEVSNLHTLPELNRGVLPSAEFIWLRFQDRNLWYPLNSAGGKTPTMEGAAVFNQYQAEVAAWRENLLLTEPHVEEALDGWREYLMEAKLISASGGINASA